MFAHSNIINCESLFQNRNTLRVQTEIIYGDAGDGTFISEKLGGDIKNFKIQIPMQQSNTSNITHPTFGGIFKTENQKSPSKDNPKIDLKINTHSSLKSESKKPLSIQLLEKLISLIPYIIDDYLNSSSTSNPRPFTKELSQILSSFYFQIPSIEMKRDTHPIFSKLPKDKIAATIIGDPNSSIYFKQNDFFWGEISTIDLSDYSYSENPNDPNVPRKPLAEKSELMTLFQPNTDLMAQSTNVERIKTLIRILIHEKAHQIGLTDEGKITPDQVASSLQNFLNQQVTSMMIPIDDQEHPWLKLIQIKSTTNKWDGAILGMDSEQVTDFIPHIKNWLHQAYSHIEFTKIRIDNLHFKTSQNWDPLIQGHPVILQGDLFLLKSNDSELHRPIELILFYGGEWFSTPDHMKNYWDHVGTTPTFVEGHSDHSTLQIRFLPLKKSGEPTKEIPMKVPWPTISVKQGDPWDLYLETERLPSDLELKSVEFILTPMELNNDTWIRNQEFIRVPGRWEFTGGKALLFGNYNPPSNIKTGTYLIKEIKGVGFDKKTSIDFPYQILASDVYRIIVSEKNNSSKINLEDHSPEISALVLQSYGKGAVKLISPMDQTRTVEVNQIFNPTADLNINQSNLHKGPIPVWTQVPFAFNRPFDVQKIFIHGSLLVEDLKGQEMTYLVSAPMEELTNLVKISKIYKNKIGSTVMELSFHLPLTINHRPFLYFHVTGFTIIEKNFHVSKIQVQLNIGRKKSDK